MLAPWDDETPPFGVILETSMTADVFDSAFGGDGHFWLKEHGVFTTTTFLPARFATALRFRIFGYGWMEYESEVAIGFSGHIASGPSDLVDLPVFGMLVRPAVPGQTILGFIYRSKTTDLKEQ